MSNAAPQLVSLPTEVLTSQGHILSALPGRDPQVITRQRLLPMLRDETTTLAIEDDLDDVLDVAIDANDLETFETYSSDAAPVFVGHYWLAGTPKPLATNVACTDYSVAKGGKLVAYRWDGESTLHEEKFHWVGD